MTSIQYSNSHGGSIYRPLSNSRRSDLEVTAQQPFPRNAWITCALPALKDEYFLFGTASPGLSGIYALRAEHDRLGPLWETNAKIWDLCLTARHTLLALADDNTLLKAQMGTRGVLEGRTEVHIPLMNRRVEQIRGMPGSGGYLACHDGSVARLYSLAEGIKSNGVIGEATSEERLGMLQWSPHDPTVISLASMDRSFRLYDVRAGGHPVYESALAVTTRSKIKWNPFIPYWMGVTTDAGTAIYDLRYSPASPLIMLDEYGVNDFEWSNSNCELLLSVSGGREISVWNLRSPSERRLELCHDALGGAICQLFPSSRELNAFHGLSLLGKVVHLELSKSFVLAEAPGSESGNKKVEEIERSLYSRDAETVYKKLLEYSDDAETGRFRELQYLTNQTLPSMPILRDSWKYGDRTRGDGSFAADLDKYSRICPPGFDVGLFSSRDGSIREAVELIRFKVKILELVQSGDVQRLSPLLDRILAVCEQSPAFLKSKTLLDIVETLATRPKEMLAFGREVLLRVIRTWNEVAAQMVHRLLYPTIFDREAVQLVALADQSHDTPQSPLRQHSPTACKKETDPREPLGLEPPQPPMIQGRRAASSGPGDVNTTRAILLRIERLDVALAMIDLEQQLALEPAEAPHVQIKAVVESLTKNPDETICARTIWIFIVELLSGSRVDVYLQAVGRIAAQGGPFAEALVEHMHQLVLPKIKYTLAQAIETQRPTLVLGAITLIVLMGQVRLSQGLEPLLVDRLRCLIKSLVSEDYSSLRGFDTLVALLNGMDLSGATEGLWREFARLKLILVPQNTDDKRPHYPHSPLEHPPVQD